jgi:hypothetical protein
MDIQHLSQSYSTKFCFAGGAAVHAINYVISGLIAVAVSFIIQLMEAFKDT